MKVYAVNILTFAKGKCKYYEWIRYHGIADLEHGVNRRLMDFEKMNAMRLTLGDESIDKVILPSRGTFMVVNASLCALLGKLGVNTMYKVHVKKIFDSKLWTKNVLSLTDFPEESNVFDIAPPLNANYNCYEIRAKSLYSVAEEFNISDEIELMPESLRLSLKVPIHKKMFIDNPILYTGHFVIREDVFNVLVPYMDSRMFTVASFDLDTQAKHVVF